MLLRYLAQWSFDVALERITVELSSVDHAAVEWITVEVSSVDLLLLGN